MKWLLFILCALPAFAADAGAKPRVAATYFRNNSASEELGYFSKGLAALITADLADSGRVVALDRERLEEVLAEKKLGETKYADKESFGKLASILGVEYLVAGSITKIGKDTMIAVEIIHSDTHVVAGRKVKLDPDDVFGAVELISKFAIESVTAAKAENAPAKPSKLPFGIALKYAKALDAKDKKDPVAAKTMLAEVVKEQPDFKLAQLDLLALTR
jgi:TolB-like protein